MLNVSNSLYILFGYLDALVTFPLSKYTYLNGFDCLEGRFELKIRRRNQPCEMVGPSRARCTEKCGNLNYTIILSPEHVPIHCVDILAQHSRDARDMGQSATFASVLGKTIAKEKTRRSGWRR